MLVLLLILPVKATRDIQRQNDALIAVTAGRTRSLQPEERDRQPENPDYQPDNLALQPGKSNSQPGNLKKPSEKLKKQPGNPLNLSVPLIKNILMFRGRHCDVSMNTSGCLDRHIVMSW